MAWSDPLPGGKKFRGAYRDSAGKKQYVKDDDGQTVHYDRKSDAKFAATEAEVAARRKPASRATVIAQSTTWGEWWDQIAPDRVKPDTETHLVDARIVEKYLRPRWGQVNLTDITNKKLQGWVDDELSPGRKASYVRRIWSPFSASMTAAAAVDTGVLDANPCAGIKLPKRRKAPKLYMEDDHTAKLGDKLNPAYQDMVDFELETGLRPGELCGLHATRLDLDQGFVVAAEVRLDEIAKIRPYPKDDDARVIPLTSAAIAIGKRALEGRDLTTGCGLEHTDGSTCTSVLVFLTPTKKPARPRTYSKMLNRAAKDAKAPIRSPYTARRGFATWAAHGLDAFELAELMGHSDVAQTREYVQMTPAARGRLLAARGERQPLKAVPGAAGADSGADRENQAESDPSTSADGTTVRPA